MFQIKTLLCTYLLWTAFEMILFHFMKYSNSTRYSISRKEQRRGCHRRFPSNQSPKTSKRVEGTHRVAFLVRNVPISWHKKALFIDDRSAAWSASGDFIFGRGTNRGNGGWGGTTSYSVQRSIGFHLMLGKRFIGSRGNQHVAHTFITTHTDTHTCIHRQLSGVHAQSRTRGTHTHYLNWPKKKASITRTVFDVGEPAAVFPCCIAAGCSPGTRTTSLGLVSARNFLLLWRAARDSGP